GRRRDRVKQIAKEFSEAYNTSVKGLVFDVRKRKAVEKAIDGLGEEVGIIDILVNNAGKAKGFDAIHEGDFEHWEEMIDTNIKGLLYLTRLIAPHMVANKKGHIINIGSIAGKEPYPKGNVYCATKYAVDGLTKAMRMDLHEHNVRVSQIAPAHVEETEFALVRFDGDEKKSKIYEDFTPVNSTDIAETIYFMATRPHHVNILDVVIQGTQQASALVVDRSGRK
ncbi:MAG: SDR family NAD(P)-dependent oxidoreductase, partial [Bacteroidetes bacterium]